MSGYSELKGAINRVIKTNNNREITGQILQNTLNSMVNSLGANYQFTGFASPTMEPGTPDQNIFYITNEPGQYTNFGNIELSNGLSFLMWKNNEWTSNTLIIGDVTREWVTENFASKSWVNENFITIDFFDSLFKVYNDKTYISPNSDIASIVDKSKLNIKAMFGFWTEQYLSALGLGNGSTVSTTLAALNDVSITYPLLDGQALVYDEQSNHWVNATIQSGVDMSVVWAALAGATNEQINISHLTTALNDYVTATSLATTLQSYVTTSALATELANYASQSWVETNYISKAFFNSLFEAQDVNGNAITPNNSGQTTIDRLKILVGAYTEQYLSALGLSSGGGGGSSTLSGLNDVTITNPQDGQALIYDEQSGHWVNGAAISMSAVWTALAAATSEQINSSHLTTALSGYVTTSALASELANYVTTSSLATTLADYVTTSALTTTLADYGSKTWIDNNYVSKAFFNRLFQAFAPLAEGQTEPTQVEPNDTTTTIDNIKAMFGLWTEQYLSALGLSAGGGGGYTLNEPLSSINSAALGTPSQANVAIVWNGTAWTYGTTMSSVSWNDITNKPTTLAGYGITDAYISNGTITLGANSITPVTSLSGYATESWVSSQLGSYLPLSGGTLTNTNRDILTLNQTSTTGTTGAYISFKNNGNLQCNIGHNTVDGSFIDSYYGGASSPYSLILKGTSIKYNSKELATQEWVGQQGYAYSSSLSNYLPLSGGTITTTTATGYNKAPLKIYNSGTEQNVWMLSMLSPNVASDANVLLMIGKANETGKSAWFGFRNSSASLGGFATIGLYDKDNLINIFSDGQSGSGCYVGIGTTSPSYMLDVNGSINGKSVYYNGNACIHAGNIGSQSVNYANSAGSAPASDVYSWAKASTKPSYGFSEITGSIASSQISASTITTSLGYTPVNKAGDTINGKLIISKSSYPLRLQTSGSESSMVFAASGSTASYGQYIVGCYTGTSSGNPAFFLYDATLGYQTLHIENGRIGIGTRANYPSYMLHVDGDIYATGGVTAASDERLKDVYDNISLSVEQIANAPAVRFYWKADHSKGLQAGTLAQYWQSVLPEVVSDRNNELGMQYGVTALVSVVGVARKVVNHEQRITELEKECANWREAYNTLRMDYEQLKLKIA